MDRPLKVQSSKTPRDEQEINLTEAYSERYQKSKVERFAEINGVDYFRKTIDLRCLTGF